MYRNVCGNSLGFRGGEYLKGFHVFSLCFPCQKEERVYLLVRRKRIRKGSFFTLLCTVFESARFPAKFKEKVAVVRVGSLCSSGWQADRPALLPCLPCLPPSLVSPVNPLSVS